MACFRDITSGKHTSGMLPDNVTLGIPGITRSWSASKAPLRRSCAKVVWYHMGCVAGDGRELVTLTSGGKGLFSYYNQSVQITSY